MCRLLASLLSFVLAVLIAPPACAVAVTLNVVSVNLLHFGQGSTTAQKCAQLNALAQTTDVILIQELMTSAYPCDAVVPRPAGFLWQPALPPGQGSYTEYFGVLYANTAAGHARLALTTTAPPTLAPNTFSRPPAALLFYASPAAGGAGRYVWLVNVHSIWGDVVGPRQQEARAAAAFGIQLRSSTAMVPGSNPPYQLNGATPVLFGGDWNLETNRANGSVNPGFSVFSANQFAFAPNNQTSLTPPGNLSKRYDHFVYSTGPAAAAALTVATPQRLPCPPAGFPCQPWRNNVSDHLGIRTIVGIP
ncbi:MAG: endonuclease/exonuclease/phosphatase family protein [Dokdonella sp.]